MNFTFITEASATSQTKKQFLPLYDGDISCSLFGISEDFTEKRLSLDEHLVKNKNSTFLVRANGDSMKPVITTGDILVIDKSVELKSGLIAGFFYFGQPICKQYFVKKNHRYLHSFNSKYKPILITDDTDIQLFGVVTGLARSFLW